MLEKIDNTVQTVTDKVEKAIQSLPPWLQWTIFVASIGVLLTELLPNLIRRFVG